MWRCPIGPLFRSSTDKVLALTALLAQALLLVMPGIGSASIATVRTAQQLKDALDDGIKHIHLVDHLDLTTLAAASPDVCGGSCASRDPSASASGSAPKLHPGLFLAPEVQSLTVCLPCVGSACPITSIAMGQNMCPAVIYAAHATAAPT